MEFQKKGTEQNAITVSFSKDKVFTYGGVDFQVFDTGKQYPKRAIRKANTQEWISGLFPVANTNTAKTFNSFCGDFISKGGEKHLFFLKFNNDRSLTLTGFSEAIEQAGYITTQSKKHSNSGYSGASGGVSEDTKERGLFDD